MFSARGWSYSDSRRRRPRGAYRVARRRGRFTRLAALFIPLILTLGSVAVLTTLPATSPGRPSATAVPALDGLDEQLAVAPTAPPTDVPMVAALPIPAPTLAPTTSPTGSQPLLPNNRILAYYGNPLASQMGVLGELPADQMVSRLKQQADAYTATDGSRPVIPALELVTPAAQGWPGEDGMYRARMKPELIDQVASWAEANHTLLILDVQIGLSTVPTEVDVLMPYLRRPYVHLALDPEFAMPSGHIPGQVVGTLDAATVDGAIHTLSQLVETEHLPPKVLIVHRFSDDMLTNAWEIAHDPNVQVVVTMDGFGPPDLKLAQYRAYVHDQGVGFSGIKLFYHHDNPLLTPRQVLDLDPHPDLVIYQ